MAESSSNPDVVRETCVEPAIYAAGQTTVWNQSWHDLYDKLGDVILMYARQGGLNDHSAMDVLQEVMVTVMRSQRGEVTGYNPAKGSFRKWLEGVVRNRIRSIRRADQKEHPLPAGGDAGTEVMGTSLPEIPQPPPDFEEFSEREWQKAVLAAALERLRARVKPENFQIFMALIEECATAAELSRTHGKEVNNIYRIKNSCQTMIAEEANLVREYWERLHAIGT